MAARHINELRAALAALGLSLHELLVEMEDSEYAGKQSTREMWSYLADMCDDGRFLVFCVFEDEYAVAVYDKRVAHLRSKTRQGFKGAFGIMDYAEHYHYVDKEVTKSLVQDYTILLPKTFAQVEAVRMSDLYGGMEASAEERTLAACALADDLHERIQEGAKVMAQEQAKNYRHLDDVPLIFLYMFCRGRAGACVRAMLTVLSDEFKRFDDVDFVRANILRVDDKWFLDRIVPHAAKLDDLFKLLRFYDPVIASDFATLSGNLPCGRFEDTLVDLFVHGKALPSLFRHCVSVVGALPVDESLVELTFSAEKTIHRPNESREKTSHELQYQLNTVAPLRSERSLMAAGSKNKGNHSTLAQVHKAGVQMLRVTKKYTPPLMSTVAGRRRHQGKLKRADAAQADAAVDLKLSERAKQTSRKAPSALTLRQRQLKLCSEPTKHEKELAIIGQVTDEDRRCAVVSEVKFKGQVGAAAAFFSVFKAEDQRRLLQATLPLCFGFALTITDPQAVSWWWTKLGRNLVPRTDMYDSARLRRKKAPAAVVLQLVREMRNVLLRELPQFLSDGERKMMGVMRLGVLRTSAGITEVDEALRVRTTKIK
jgi:hypothetical protein